MGKKHKNKKKTKYHNNYGISYKVKAPQINQAAYTVFGSLYYNPSSD